MLVDIRYTCEMDGLILQSQVNRIPIEFNVITIITFYTWISNNEGGPFNSLRHYTLTSDEQFDLTLLGNIIQRIKYTDRKEIDIILSFIFCAIHPTKTL